MADYQSYIGAQMLVAPGAKPATRDAAGYQVLRSTMSTLGKIVSIGAVGDTNNAIEIDTLSAGRVVRVMGSADGGAVDITLVSDIDDEGQIDLASIAGSNVESTFLIVDPAPSNEEVWFGGLVTSMRDTERNTTSYKGKTGQLFINTPQLRITT